MPLKIAEHIPGKRLTLVRWDEMSRLNMPLVAFGLAGFVVTLALALATSGIFAWGSIWNLFSIVVLGIGLLFFGASDYGDVTIDRHEGVRIVRRSEAFPFIRTTQALPVERVTRVEGSALLSIGATTHPALGLTFGEGASITVQDQIRGVMLPGEMLRLLADIGDIFDLSQWRDDSTSGGFRFRIARELEDGKPIAEARAAFWELIDPAPEPEASDAELIAFDRTARLEERSPTELRFSSYQQGKLGLGFFGVLTVAAPTVVIANVARQAWSPDPFAGYLAAAALGATAYLALSVWRLFMQAMPRLRIALDSGQRRICQSGFDDRSATFDESLFVAVRCRQAGATCRAGAWLITRADSIGLAVHDRGGSLEETLAAVRPIAVECARRIGCPVRVMSDDPFPYAPVD